jgi:RimJ/RimL family protein N-acetyltransferase
MQSVEEDRVNRKLRRIEKYDVSTINSWRNQRELIAHLGTTFRYVSLEREYEWFEQVNRKAETQIRLVIEVDARAIGLVSLTQIDYLNGSAELSIMIGDSSDREGGVGGWAVKSLVSHAFNDLRLNRVWLTLLSDNARALRTYRSAGFL